MWPGPKFLHGTQGNRYKGYKEKSAKWGGSSRNNCSGAQGMAATWFCLKMLKMWKQKRETHHIRYYGNINFQNFQIRPVICLEGTIGWFVLKAHLHRYSMLFLLRLDYCSNLLIIYLFWEDVSNHMLLKTEENQLCVIKKIVTMFGRLWRRTMWIFGGFFLIPYSIQVIFWNHPCHGSQPDLLLTQN